MSAPRTTTPWPDPTEAGAAVPDAPDSMAPAPSGQRADAAGQGENAPAGGTPRVHLRLVRTPGPPLEAWPVTRLTVPGWRSPRPALPPGPRPGQDLPHRDDFGPAPTPRHDLPDPAAVAHRLVTTTLEAFTGRRSFAQLQSAFTLPVFTAVSRGRRPRWCVEGTGPLVVGPVRVFEPVDGVAEVTAVARRNGRAHAVAVRLEGIDGRWRCTALQVG